MTTKVLLEQKSRLQHISSSAAFQCTECERNKELQENVCSIREHREGGYIIVVILTEQISPKTIIF